MDQGHKQCRQGGAFMVRHAMFDYQYQNLRRRANRRFAGFQGHRRGEFDRLAPSQSILAGPRQDPNLRHLRKGTREHPSAVANSVPPMADKQAWTTAHLAPPRPQEYIPPSRLVPELPQRHRLEQTGRPANYKDLRDTRREVVDSATQLSGCQYILHGDVYEFRTTSATTRPLPNLRFLQLRYAVQKLFAGVQAAVEALEKPSGREEEPPNVTNSEPSRGEEEPPNVTNSEPSGGEEESPNDTNSDAGFGAWPRQGLECIFSMGVPELPEGPEPPDESYMPRDWDWMLDEAWMRGILDESSEAWWRKCILKQAYLDWCKAMAARQALVDEMGPNGGKEEE